jgi:PPOX class probable F420-dependent enzyme
MQIDITPEQVTQIQQAYYMWFTTVRADGMPQPTPVWFIWQGDKSEFLVFSQPDAQKVKNIRSNPKVALSYSADGEAANYVVIMGEAVLEENATAAHHVAAYLEKYHQGILDLGMTPESLGERFSTAIRITPERVRGE